MYNHRLLSNEDLETISTFPQTVDELFYVSPRFIFPLTPEQILMLLTNRFEPTVITEGESGQIVAYANLHDRIESTCWLGNVIVCPEHRGRGAAEVLLNIMIQKQSYGIKKLLLSCHNTNSRGLVFYNKHGFKPYDLRITRLEDDRRIITIQMERDLT